MDRFYLYYLPGTQCGTVVDQLPSRPQVVTELLLSESFDGAGHENFTTVPATNVSFKMVVVTSKEMFVIGGQSVFFL